MLTQLMQSYRPVDPSRMRAKDFLFVQRGIEQAKIGRIAVGSGWRDVNNCPLCGDGNHKYEFTKDAVGYVCCAVCGVRYSLCIPASLDDVYASPDYLSYSVDETDEAYNYRRERFGRERVGILERHCGDLHDKRILDVGCGNGYFLSVVMEKCQHCYGTEFSAKLREFAQHKTGLPIFAQDLDNLPERDFDIITLFDVLEHIPDPLPFMRSVDRLLNPGGSVLIFTPNFDSFSVRVMREYSSIVDPTEHVVLYTRDSLHHLAALMGYGVVYEETRGMDVVNVLALQDYFGERRDAILTERGDELQAMIDVAGCGDYGRIMLRKDDSVTDSIRGG